VARQLREGAPMRAGISMDLSYSAEYLQFRDEVRQFLGSHWRASRDEAAVAAFRRLATSQGYLNRSIPKIYGGSQQSPDVMKAHIIREEFARARAPTDISSNGVQMLVPTLLEHGTDWQKEKFIPRTIGGEYLWAQGYSEPGSGSDLASLKTRGELVGGEWVINGQKIWTTRAHLCQYMFALIRTEPEADKRSGISYLLLELKQPGITIRPIHQIDGGREFCEVFFDNARTPADWIVGQRGKGWEVSKSTLKHERNWVGAAASLRDLFDKLVKLAQSTQRSGRPAIADPLIRDRLVALEGAVLAHTYSGYYQLTKGALNEEPGIIGLMNKLNSTDLGQEVAAIATDLIGPDLMKAPGGGKDRGNERWVNQVIGSLGMAIAGGTSNIQRNIIAERGLQLPREEYARE
jgi:alkylation response protein AidB-like acyl-CoA dehydrogenase